MKTIENKVRELIKASFRKRIDGLGEIDNLRTNDDLIEHWMAAVAILAANNEDVEQAAIQLNGLQSIFGEASIEDSRAFIFLISNRFSEEIAAYSRFLELKDDEPESVILFELKKELEYIEKGELLFA